MAIDVSAALAGPGSGLAYVNGFRLPGGEAALLFAVTTPLDAAYHESVESFLDTHRDQVPDGFDQSPSSGPRTAAITVDDDGHRNIWDLSLTRAVSGD